MGRHALHELDQLLGILRADEPDDNPVLRPSLANLGGLVTEFRELGLDVDTSIEGRSVPLPTAVDLSAFRIIQEALTNTLKHAGPTRAVVKVEYSASDLAVEVRDHGHGRRRRPVVTTGESRGIAGMRERVALLKGDIDVGPCDDVGFRVAARLPLGPVAPS